MDIDLRNSKYHPIDNKYQTRRQTEHDERHRSSHYGLCAASIVLAQMPRKICISRKIYYWVHGIPEIEPWINLDWAENRNCRLLSGSVTPIAFWGIYGHSSCSLLNRFWRLVKSSPDRLSLSSMSYQRLPLILRAIAGDHSCKVSASVRGKLYIPRLLCWRVFPLLMRYSCSRLRRSSRKSMLDFSS